MFNRVHLAQPILLGSIALACAFGASVAGSNAVRAEDNANYFGRWTVSDDKPAYSAKGKLYKTIDFAPCGNDFCGVSVDDENHCGPTLFRFLTIHAHNNELVGHGRWGDVKKKIMINYITVDGDKPYVMLGLGEDDLDLTGREGSLPAFEANYKQIGEATCKAK